MQRKRTALCCTPLSPRDLETPSTRHRLLGITLIGSEDVVRSAGDDDWPLQHIRAPLLGASAAGEMWLGSAGCRSGSHGEIRFRSDGEVLYGVIDIDESGVSAHETSPLQAAAAAAYREIFALLDAEGFPQLWRVWNYLPAINGDSHGLERYRQFNLGRHQAFVDCCKSAARSPAACALGVVNGPLSIAFIAGRVAPLTVENPRQISAYAYPRDYGPCSPTFSRAVLVQLPTQELLFVSGTASIVGHRTLHIGDVVAQTVESLINIAAVIAEANRLSAAPYRSEELSYRAYVRNSDDFARVREAVDGELGAAAISYVHADICRSDLLVEIEAMAIRSGEAVATGDATSADSVTT